MIASLAVLLDLVLEHLSPDTNVPAIANSRTMTRYVLAMAAALFLALKFIFHLAHIGNYGVGCWLGIVLVGMLAYGAASVRHEDPPGKPRE